MSAHSAPIWVPQGYCAPAARSSVGMRASVSLATSLASSLLLGLVGPSACSSCAGATLFFSQYQEQEQDATTDRSAGPANYLQIYNPLSVAVDLAKDFSIATCLNGCSREDTFEYGLPFKFGATIAAQGTYTLCSGGLKDHEGCDMVLASPYQDLITGNDLIALIYGTDYTRATRHDVVDQIGRFPTPTPAWP